MEVGSRAPAGGHRSLRSIQATAGSLLSHPFMQPVSGPKITSAQPGHFLLPATNSGPIAILPWG